ncbi:MAG: hypothetical protein IPL41_16305 [Micropruina sp.]|nr:hypothetical protein [Micropruina sp.]
MPKPQWAWFAVAVAALTVGILLANAGWMVTDNRAGPPGGLVIAALGLLAVWSFGKAFFNFRLPKD